MAGASIKCDFIVPWGGHDFEYRVKKVTDIRFMMSAHCKEIKRFTRDEGRSSRLRRSVVASRLYGKFYEYNFTTLIAL